MLANKSSFIEKENFIAQLAMFGRGSPDWRKDEMLEGHTQ